MKTVGIFGDFPTMPTGMAIVCKNLALGLSNYPVRVVYFGRFGQQSGVGKEPILHENSINYDLVPCVGGVWRPRTVIEAVEQYDIDIIFTEDDFFSAGGLVRASKKTGKPLHFLTPIDSLPINSMAYRIFKECKKVYVPNSSYKLIKNGVFLPHGCDREVFYPHRLYRDPDLFTFVWIGRDEPRKAMGRFIFALEKVVKKVDCQAIIHSDWRANLAKRTARYLRYKRDLPVIMTQMEAGGQEQLNRIYNTSDILVCTSKAGGFEMCVLPDTPVLLADSIQQINKTYKGELALIINGQLKPIEKTSMRKHKGLIYTIKTFGCNIPITFTPEHPILIRRRKNRKFKQYKLEWNKPEWIQAKDVKLGDCVLFPIPDGIYENITFDLKDFDKNLLYDGKKVWYLTGNSPLGGKKKYNRFIKLDRQFASVLGYYCAEGSVNKNELSSITFCFDSNEENYVNEVETKLSEIFGIKNFTRVKNKTARGLRTIASGKILVKFFTSLCGIGALNKRIPKEVLYNKNKSILVEFLRTAMNGDGYIYKQKSGSYSTSSHSLAIQLWVLLLRLGYKPSLQKRKGLGFSKRDSYVVNYQLERNIRNRGTRTWILDKQYLMLVRSIEISEYDGDVSDITIPNGDSFIASHFIVHNSQTEAMACGKPVITTDWTFMNEVVENYKNGFKIPVASVCGDTAILYNGKRWGVPLGRRWGEISVNALADAMRYCVENPEVVNQMSESAFDWVVDKYDWRKIAGKLYKEIME